MRRQTGSVLSRARTAEAVKSWLIMLPGLILMTFFLWGPLLESIRMSLYKTRNVELVRFIGLDNFISVTGKDDFLQALMNTFSYTFWSLLLGFALPVVLALLIGETRRGKGFFRTAVYLPNMLPGLAVIILWSAFFSGEKSGVLNVRVLLDGFFHLRQIGAGTCKDKGRFAAKFFCNQGVGAQQKLDSLFFAKTMREKDRETFRPSGFQL